MGCIKFTSLLNLAIAVPLMLGAAPQDAKADICKELSNREGCVRSKDVLNDSLTAPRHLRDEARGSFDASTATFALTSSLNTYVTVFVESPGTGSVTATAGTSISSTSDGSASCSIIADQAGSTFAPRLFFGSVNEQEFISTASMAASTSFKVKKGTVRIRLLCRLVTGGGGPVEITAPSLSAQYYPTEY